jgi:drug/metabolite transporter (DMT)-like permease
MSSSEDIKANAALISAVILWSFSFVAIRIGLESYSPGALGLLRFLVASLCLLIMFPKSAQNISISIRDLLLLAGIGVIGIAGYSIFLSTSQKTVSSGLASFMVAQTPVITATLAMFMLKEKPNLITMLGIGISCLGVSIIWQGQPVHIDLDTGLMLLVLATICGSLHSIWQKHALAGLSPYQVTAISTWFAAAALLVFLPALLSTLKHASLHASMAVIFLGIIPSTVGQLLWCYGLSRTRVLKATAYLYAMPFLSTIFGWLILGEIPTGAALLGGSIALLGAVIVKKI